MRLTIANEALTVSVETLGAQLMSVRTADGTEYLWQGDSATWPDRAPVLFPYIGRLQDNSYCFHEKQYHMGIHGFAAASVFTPAEQREDSLVLALESTEETRRQYPFAFRLEITYALHGASLAVTYRVDNHSDCVMPFGIGGHPGFRVPLEPGESFEDYQIEFGCRCQPDRVGFTDHLLISGEDRPFILEDHRILPLRHSMFDEDAIILHHTAREATLRSRKSSRSVRISFPDFPYFGIWHWPHSEAAYVCLEPWSSLPSRQDMVEELSCKSDLIHLKPNDTYKTTWTISLT